MKKRVVVYLTGMNSSGGKERVVSNLLKEWCNSYDVTLITKDIGETFYELPFDINKVSLNTPFLTSMFNMKNNRYIRVISTCLNMLCSVFLLKRTLSHLCYDYIYVTTPLNAFETYYAIKDADKKLVISEHASIDAYNKVYSWMKRKIYPKVYCISVPNEMDTDAYNIWGCNAIYIPHLVTYKAEHKNYLNTNIVLNVGRLTADKQQDILLRMWASVKDKGSWKLWIVGDGENRDKLVSLIDQLGVQNSVELLPARKDIQSIYRQASLFAFSSRSEGFGMVLVEAMSFGIPCISFDCLSGPRDVIKDGVNGYLIENGNINSYINKLEVLINMPLDELSKLGDQSFKTVVEWDNAKILSQWDSVFE